MALRKSACCLSRHQGAIHPNGTNFRRSSRYDVVARVRKLCEMGVLKKRPDWLEWAERVPPMENHSLNVQVRKIRNPYPQMVNFLLEKYPDLRFQDCYVDGNDWSVGNDTFRDDHPVMQFVARQLEFMNKGMSKKKAFEETEILFRERREYLEREQKVLMAMALDSGIAPMFTSGRAYLQAEVAKAEETHLRKILWDLRNAKKDAAAEAKGEDRKSIPELRMEQRAKQREMIEQRTALVGSEELYSDVLDESVAMTPETPPVHGEQVQEPDSMQAAEQDVREEDRAMQELLGREEELASTREGPPLEWKETGAAEPLKDFSPEKPPEESIAITRPRPRDGRRKTIGRKDMGAILDQGVHGEDMSFFDDDADAAARRSRIRRQGYDDESDDENDLESGVRGKRRR